MDMHELHDLAGSVIGVVPREEAITYEAEFQRDKCWVDAEAWIENWIADPVELLAKILKECASSREATVIGQRVADIVQQEWRRVAVHNVEGRE